jgi:hypothetical protein
MNSGDFFKDRHFIWVKVLIRIIITILTARWQGCQPSRAYWS